jgi:hypothetical protein
MNKTFKITAISISSILAFLVISIIPFGTYSLATFALDKSGQYELSSGLDFGTRNLGRLSEIKNLTNITSCGENLYASLPENLVNKNSFESKNSLGISSNKLIDLKLNLSQVVAKDYSSNQEITAHGILSKEYIGLFSMMMPEIGSVLNTDQKVHFEGKAITNNDIYFSPSLLEYTNGEKKTVDNSNTFYKLPNQQKATQNLSQLRPKEIMSKESYIALGNYLCSGIEKVSFGTLEDRNGIPVRKINIEMKKEVDVFYAKSFAPIFEIIAKDSVFKNFIRNSKFIESTVTLEQIKSYQARFDSDYDKVAMEILESIKKTNYFGNYLNLKPIELEINTSNLSVYSETVSAEIQIPGASLINIVAKSWDFKTGNLETIQIPNISETQEQLAQKMQSGNVVKELGEIGKLLTPAPMPIEENSQMQTYSPSYSPEQIKAICAQAPANEIKSCQVELESFKN